MVTNEFQNRDMRIVGFNRMDRDLYSEFHMNNVGREMRVHGLILFGTTKHTKIYNFQVGNEYIVMDTIPADAFAKADVTTFEEAQRELEAGGHKLLRRQAMQCILNSGCQARLTVSGGCGGAAMYCELIAMPHIQPRRVAVTREGSQWRGEIFEETLLGDARTLDITADSEDAVMQGVIAGLGGVRVRVG